MKVVFTVQGRTRSDVDDRIGVVLANFDPTPDRWRTTVRVTPLVRTAESDVPGLWTAEVVASDEAATG